jgi:peptide deformylase
MIRDMRVYGDPVLRLKAQEVKAFDQELETLVEDMFETMEHAGGVGLAAPQVGVSQRVLVIDLKQGPNYRSVVINPKIQTSGEPNTATEGCLSIPGISGEVTRPSHVCLEGLDLKGKKVEFEADGLMARALQHEVDHLDGIFFVDRLSAVRRSLLSGKLKRLERDFASGRTLEKVEKGAEPFEL